MVKLIRLMKELIKPILRPLSNRIHREVDIRSVAGWTPITEFLKEDVFIVGYPKSGNTWFQNLVTGVVYGVNPEFAPDTLVQEIVPDVHYKQYYKRLTTPMFFMSHHLPRPNYKRVVYLLRDGRDVMVSYYHHNRALKGDDFDFYDMVRNGEELFPCKWHKHVEAWIANPYDTEMIIIRYEELKKDPVGVLRRFCEFIGEDRDEALLHTVALKSSFRKMHEKEDRYGWDNHSWPKDKHFVRRGEVGSYKDEMPEEVLEAFLQESRETLRNLGY